VFWFWWVTFRNRSSMRKEKWNHLHRLNAFQNLAAWKENGFIYKTITLQIVFFVGGKLLMTKTSIKPSFLFYMDRLLPFSCFCQININFLPNKSRSKYRIVTNKKELRVHRKAKGEIILVIAHINSCILITQNLYTED